MSNINPNNKKKVDAWIRYSTLGIQMGGTIAFFTWLGTWLDKKTDWSTPVWTIVLSLFGVIASLYLVVREVIKQNKIDDKE